MRILRHTGQIASTVSLTWIVSNHSWIIRNLKLKEMVDKKGLSSIKTRLNGSNEIVKYRSSFHGQHGAFEATMSFSLPCTWSKHFDNYGMKMAGFWTFVEGNVTCIASLSFTFLQCFGAIILAFLVGRKLPSLEKWIIAWLFYDAMTHFSLVRDAWCPQGAY